MAEQFLEAGIEALDMADLQKDMMPFGQFEHLLGLADGLGHRLFDQKRQAARQEFGGEGGMMRGRSGDDDGIHERQQVVMIAEGTGAATLGHRLDLGDMGIDDADQLDIRQRRQNPGVFLAEMSDADHSHPQTRHKFPFSDSPRLR
jgi:hypothetical protein